jgi:hypothetical protein
MPAFTKIYKENLLLKQERLVKTESTIKEAPSKSDSLGDV